MMRGRWCKEDVAAGIADRRRSAPGSRGWRCGQLDYQLGWLIASVGRWFR